MTRALAAMPRMSHHVNGRKIQIPSTTMMEIGSIRVVCGLGFTDCRKEVFQERKSVEREITLESEKRDCGIEHGNS